jgi:putative transposase
MLVFHCRRLEQVVAEFVAHDNGHRPHRSLAQHAPLGVSKTPLRTIDPDPAQLRRSDILGGLVNEYRLVAWADWMGFSEPTGAKSGVA